VLMPCSEQRLIWRFAILFTGVGPDEPVASLGRNHSEVYAIDLDLAWSRRDALDPALPRPVAPYSTPASARPGAINEFVRQRGERVVRLKMRPTTHAWW